MASEHSRSEVVRLVALALHARESGDDRLADSLTDRAGVMLRTEQISASGEASNEWTTNVFATAGVAGGPERNRATRHGTSV
jgi:hypothetical protein